MSVDELFNSHTTLWYKIVNISVSQRRKPRHREVEHVHEFPELGFKPQKPGPVDSVLRAVWGLQS